MTDSKVLPNEHPSQANYEIEAEVQLVDNNNAIKAHADVTIALVPGGSIKIYGFSIFDSGDKPIRVFPPARKGKQRYFDIVLLLGEIRQVVDDAVKAAYRLCEPKR